MTLRTDTTTPGASSPAPTPPAPSAAAGDGRDDAAPHLTSPLPVWLDDETLDPGWVAAATGLPCASCRAVDSSNATRKGTRTRDGATLLLHLTLSDGSSEQTPKTLVLKQVGAAFMQTSRNLGLAREGLAYRYLLRHDKEGAIDVARYCPKVYYAYGNFGTGDKAVIMEHLGDAVDSAAFFGPGSPHNWNKDLPLITSRAPEATARSVASQTFRAAAALHAKHWRDAGLLDDDHTWLRGQQWLRGRDRASWEAAQSMARDSWHNHANSNTISWDETLRACVDKAIRGISWEAQQKRLRPDGLWTLVHGDFWPGNAMYLVKERDIRLLDWEMCGLGSGPQDLGQYIISNMEPDARRQHDRALLEEYHQELLNRGVHDVSWEHVWREYRVGGMERWMWFLAYFLGLEGFAAWAQFFHDQMASFLHDHKLTADDFTQVRP